MTPNNHFSHIATELNISTTQVANTLALLNDGGTIPFIARYRKEKTGSLDEVVIAAIKDKDEKFVDLVKRRAAIIESLEKLGKLTPHLQQSLAQASNQAELEDLYLPHRPKRKTRAEIARSQGLSPLATQILQHPDQAYDVERFVASLKEPMSIDDALSGAQDIVAEHIAENRQTRESLRRLYKNQATLQSRVIKGKELAGEKYKDYFDWQEPIRKAAGHRILAMLRGEREKILKLVVRPAKEDCLGVLEKKYLRNSRGSTMAQLLLRAIADSYQRLLAPTLEKELLNELKSGADDEAIAVFSENLKQLLLAPPLGPKRVLAIDPGYRTGGKVVCLSKQGDLLETQTIFPTSSEYKKEQAKNVIVQLVQEHRIEAIGIGNGTAGRETESFIRSIGLDTSIIITMVNEDGASIYSASEVGRSELGEYDITVRGAVSIGRRLQDPLAELVKIDPKSIGVGQYQHDVNQAKLKKGLDRIVEFCVNSVGVELNSASRELLTYIAGIGPTIATNIIQYREVNGPFRSLKELSKVPRLGPKAYEQCAGFLRIRNGQNPLDATGVHPERYSLIQRIARDLGLSLTQLLYSENIRQLISPEQYIDDEVGLPTLNDILEELIKPGRDPRQSYEIFQFSEDILSLDDLYEGLILPAIITNITKFGAFADIGIKQDGLIHISQLADRFVKDPGEIVKIGQQIKVQVLAVDSSRGRISLSMRTKS